MRSFDPIRVGSLECDAWVAYYLRRWPAFLRAAFGLTRQSFGLSAAGTARGGWWVLRANQVWAPYSDNDPAAARRSPIEQNAHFCPFTEWPSSRTVQAWDPAANPLAGGT